MPDASQEFGARSRAFTATPLAKPFGVEIKGLDLREPLASEIIGELERMFLAHPVLVFRDQRISRADQIRFSAYFGELDVSVNQQYHGDDFPQIHTVSNLDAAGRPLPVSKLANPGNYFWHTDGSYQSNPPASSLLYGVTIPEAGGTTSFASLYEAHDSLDDAHRSQLSALRLVHSWAQSRRNSGSRPPTAEEIAKSPPVTHPLVRTHPVTGHKALYLGIHGSHIEDMDRDESSALLADLVEHATQEHRVYHHHWRVGDLVMADNRCVLHRGAPDFAGATEPRILHRTVIKGDRPF
ncbi:MAG: TauD/TfdA family dioxygenase [Alphaproteobacteria bacterium]|nr:TauD/TfdA family dioxygenase [Alphaproteobacteria bacterium]